MYRDLSGHMLREFTNEDLCKDKEKYHEFSEFARKLNSREIDLEVDPFLIDCFHQPYRTRREYNHIDAYFLSIILADYREGNIIFAILKTENKANKDKNDKLNNKYVSEAMPMHGQFNTFESSFWGGNEFCDGYLKFTGNVPFIEGGSKKIMPVNEFDGLLEVGNSDISTTYAHLFINQGQLARFPYKHKMIGLFIKKNYENPMQKNWLQ